ncbi:MAG: hypothetical protein HFE86_02090 [Clostridiales bacterium]|nr:hypothetical protein [Clostridiales bacterium]
MFEQNKLNERFYAGDQWHGAKCGADRPLVRHNVIRRIGDYKISMIAGAPLSVCYSAEGVPETTDIKERAEALRSRVRQAGAAEEIAESEQPKADEIALVMSALNDYFKATAERVRLDDLKHDALKSAYLTGTGILYTYWDPDIRTGLYADAGQTKAITGDIACELLDVENVYFGDPSRDNVESQPYIILAQRRSVEELRREAGRNRRPEAEIQAIKPDNVEYMAGDRADTEQTDAKNCTVLTRLWKEWDKEGKEYKVMAMRVVRGAVIRSPWDLKIRRYPLAKFSWDKRKGSIYGDTELTYLIPNQIAINRMVTASVWAVMVMGMPLMVVNNEVVPQAITNDPGQIIRVNGSGEDVASAVRYVAPPNFSPNYDNSVNSLIANTMTHAGANDAALGDMRPDNTSAIITLREAAAQPLQPYQNAFYAFIEEVARIWAEFWLYLYGRRSLKIADREGTWYLPFDGARYRQLALSVRVEVGASPLWSETETIRTLDNLLDRQIITAEQYLQRMPKGIIPDMAGIVKEMPGQAAEMNAGGSLPDMGPGMDMAVGLPEELSSGMSGRAAELPADRPGEPAGIGIDIADDPMALAGILQEMPPEGIRDGGQWLLLDMLCRLPDDQLQAVAETAAGQGEQAAAARLLAGLEEGPARRLIEACGSEEALAAQLAALLRRLMAGARSVPPAEAAAETPEEAAVIEAIREQLETDGDGSAPAEGGRRHDG